MEKNKLPKSYAMFPTYSYVLIMLYPSTVNTAPCVLKDDYCIDGITINVDNERTLSNQRNKLPKLHTMAHNLKYALLSQLCTQCLDFKQVLTVNKCMRTNATKVLIKDYSSC